MINSKEQAWYNNISSALVVFLVALPLCLGIALASNTPPISGLIAGIVGGIIIGAFSKSPLSVSGPAAGLTAVVVDAISKMPTEKITILEKGIPKEIVVPILSAFFLAVFIAGIIQIILGVLKAGVIGNYIPNSVIKGMLAAIGLILILKQIPHFLGRDTDPEGDESYVQTNKENTFTSIYEALKNPTLMAIVIGCLGLLILILWEQKFFKSKKFFSYLSGPLVVVVMGIVLSKYFLGIDPGHLLESEHYVNVPISKTPTEFLNLLQFPDFGFITNKYVWISGITIAIIASLETLLGIEAVDKIDPYNRITPPNRELVAQGIGNITSGMLGGLPCTSVIVRSSANVNAGATSKISAILHSVFLLLTVILVPNILNLIPKAALAAILLFTGYKLIKPSVIKHYYKLGWDQFVPFAVTIIAIVATDLLKGVMVGLAFGIFYVIRENFRNSVVLTKHDNNYLIKFQKDVFFFSKPILKDKLEQLPNNCNVLIDLSLAKKIDRDIKDTLQEFEVQAKHKEIDIEYKGVHPNEIKTY
jgi:MFS superfamily sulfate permease-like transporter